MARFGIGHLASRGGPSLLFSLLVLGTGPHRADTLTMPLTDEGTHEVRMHLQGALAVHAAACELARRGWELVRIDLDDDAASTYTLTLRPAAQVPRRPPARDRRRSRMAASA